MSVPDEGYCNSSTTDVTSGAGIAIPYGAPEFTPVLNGINVARSLGFWVSLFVFFPLFSLYCLLFFY
jgi:hypothetical protein